MPLVGHTDAHAACPAAPANLVRTGLCTARADRGAVRPQPHAPSRRRPSRRLARYSGAEYYPFLLAAVKLGVALLLARLVWRFVRAQRAARAGRRVLATVGKAPGAAAPPAARPLAAALDARLPDDLDLLPPADRRRAGRLRALAVVRALAAQARRCRSSRCSPCSSRSPGAGSPPGCANTSATPRTPAPAQAGSARPSRAAACPRTRLHERRRATRTVRPRLREPTAAPPRVARGQRPEPAGPLSSRPGEVE